MSIVPNYSDIAPAIVAAPDKIHEAVFNVAAKINSNLEFSNTQSVVLVGVLSGCTYFMHDLIKRIKGQVQTEYVFCQSYKGMNQQKPVVTFAPGYLERVANKHVILVDELCDTGNTFEAIIEEHIKFMLDKPMPRKIQTCSLGIKNRVKGTKKAPTFYDLVFEDASWLVGYGLDDNGLYRESAYIYDKKKLKGLYNG